MTVYQDRRRGIWRYDFWKGGVRHVADCPPDVKSKRAAAQVEAAARLRLHIEPTIPEPTAVTLNSVADQLLAQWNRGRNVANNRCYVAEILARFGDMPVQEIGTSEISAYIDWALAQPLKRWCGEKKGYVDGDTKRSPATVNRYLVPLRQMLKRAAKMRDGVTGRPILPDPPEVPELAAPKRIPRPVPDAVATRLLEILPEHVRDAMTLTLFFGFRRDEVFGLTVAHIDRDAGGLRLPAEMVKANRDEFLPGAPAAMALLTRLARQAAKRGVPNLISWRHGQDGEWKPLASPKRAWATAMKVIEKEFGQKWRWHDLRAAYITHLALTVKSGRTVQAMARHKDFSTTQRYIAVTEEVMAQAAKQAATHPALIAKKSHTAVPHKTGKRSGNRGEKAGKVAKIQVLTGKRPRSSAG